LPVGRAQQGRQGPNSEIPNAEGRDSGDDHVVTRDGEDVGLLTGMQVLSQARMIAIDTVSHDPIDVQVCLPETLKHELSQLGFGPKRDVVRDTNRGTTGRIVGPGRQQIEFTVDESMAHRSDERKEDTDLAIAHIAGGAIMLLAHAR
jgi:hypothetical protein